MLRQCAQNSHLPSALRVGHTVPPAERSRRTSLFDSRVTEVARFAGHFHTVGGVVGAPVARLARVGAREQAVKSRLDESGLVAAARAVHGGVAALVLRADRRGLVAVVACKTKQR